MNGAAPGSSSLQKLYIGKHSESTESMVPADHLSERPKRTVAAANQYDGWQQSTISSSRPGMFDAP